MLDTITFKGKELEIKNKLNYGEITGFQQYVGKLVEIQDQIKTTENIDELEKLALQGLKITNQQAKLITDCIMKSLGTSQEFINTLHYEEAQELFKLVFENSVIQKKNLPKPSA